VPQIAVVTPYYKEPDDILLQCHDSVLRQTIPCTHILVADGYPRPIFNNAPDLLHITLPRANADVGNTPRALGGIAAESYGFDAVTYLDADNWYEPEHLANLWQAHQQSGHPLVTCKRRFYDPNGIPMPIVEFAEDANTHVDTSCWLIARPAFSMLRAWLMPKPLSPVGDRIFFQKALHERFAIDMTNHRTVAFRTRYADHFRAANMPVPDDAKGNDTFDLPASYLRTPDGIVETIRALGFYPLL
jgi:glycosyltransferase involved in cell wall biosynthesis